MARPLLYEDKMHIPIDRVDAIGDAAVSDQEVLHGDE
jgi:hypothetical protein